MTAPSSLDRAFVVESATVRAVFDLTGARLSSLTFDGTEVLVTSDPRADVWYGGFVMAPWAGIIPASRVTVEGTEHALEPTWGPDALHGIARAARFERSGDGLAARLESGPWAGELGLTARAGDGELIVRMVLRADRAMPAVVGWHPWFARSLRGVAAEPLVLGDAALQRGIDESGPTGRWVEPAPGPWDDTFTGAYPMRLTWPGVGELTLDADVPFLGIYDGEADGIAIEPMTGVPGVPETVVPAGGELSMTVRIAWESA